MSSAPDFRALLRTAVSSPQDGRAPHVSADDLIAYHQDELDPRDAAGIQEHLVGCGQCSELFAALLRFEAGAAEGEPAPSAQQQAAAWERLKRQLPETAPAPLAEVVPMPIRQPAAKRSGLARRGRQAGLWQALAAGLALALLPTLWLAVQAPGLRREVAALQQPQRNTAVEVLSLPTVRSDAADRQQLAIAPGSEGVTLSVRNPSAETFPEYEVELSQQDGDLLWAGRGLVPGRFGTINLTLSRRLAPSGDYHLRLFGLAGGDRKPVAEYDFSLRYL